ncbi:translation initiation factor IF-2-like [Paramacrobiotus metropolitanus]|uniref:translation initiation factor IF-2-like n=1 Tax=Paramacrobiotus metropolitanus TaxID=2943436 RepID=UPI0024458670|nr:translation initiation factor IF-2-like [Paramacrobiotus metropolitanus]
MSTTGSTANTNTPVGTTTTQTRVSNSTPATDDGDATGLPKLARFDPEVMRLETWSIQFDSHMESYAMADDKKKPLLLGSLNPKAMEMLASMCRPKEPVPANGNATIESGSVSARRLEAALPKVPRFEAAPDALPARRFEAVPEIKEQQSALPPVLVQPEATPPIPQAPVQVPLAPPVKKKPAPKVPKAKSSSNEPGNPGHTRSGRQVKEPDRYGYNAKN